MGPLFPQGPRNRGSTPARESPRAAHVQHRAPQRCCQPCRARAAGPGKGVVAVCLCGRGRAGGSEKRAPGCSPRVRVPGQRPFHLRRWPEARGPPLRRVKGGNPGRARPPLVAAEKAVARSGLGGAGRCTSPSLCKGAVDRCQPWQRLDWHEQQGSEFSANLAGRQPPVTVSWLPSFPWRVPGLSEQRIRRLHQPLRGPDQRSGGRRSGQARRPRLGRRRRIRLRREQRWLGSSTKSGEIRSVGYGWRGAEQRDVEGAASDAYASGRIIAHRRVLRRSGGRWQDSLSLEAMVSCSLLAG